MLKLEHEMYISSEITFEVLLWFMEHYLKVDCYVIRFRLSQICKNYVKLLILLDSMLKIEFLEYYETCFSCA